MRCFAAVDICWNRRQTAIGYRHHLGRPKLGIAGQTKNPARESLAGFLGRFLNQRSLGVAGIQSSATGRRDYSRGRMAPVRPL